MSREIWIQNPNVMVERVQKGGQLVFQVAAPVRGKNLQATEINEQDEPDLFHFFSRLFGRPKIRSVPLRSVGPCREILKKIGFFIKKNEISRPVFFYCFLGDSHSRWVPRRFRRRHKRVPQSEEIIHPSFAFQRSKGTPQANYLPGHPMIWITDPGTRVATPYWIRKKDEVFVKSLHRGRGKCLSTISQSLRSKLEDVEVLTTASHLRQRERIWGHFIKEARAHFRSKRYVVIRDLLHPFQLAAARRYYQDLIREGFVRLGYQVPGRYGAHNERLARFLHDQLTYLVSRIVGERVKPSYAYFISYEPGAALNKHRDREPCEFSISFLLDYRPEPFGVSPWPLYLEGNHTTARVLPVFLRIGDALLYKGRELSHFRKKLPAGHRSTSLLLHYVRENYRGPLS